MSWRERVQPVVDAYRRLFRREARPPGQDKPPINIAASNEQLKEAVSFSLNYQVDHFNGLETKAGLLLAVQSILIAVLYTIDTYGSLLLLLARVASWMALVFLLIAVLPLKVYRAAPGSRARISAWQSLAPEEVLRKTILEWSEHLDSLGEANAKKADWINRALPLIGIGVLLTVAGLASMFLGINF